MNINRGGRKRNPNAIRDESGKSRGERFDPTPFMMQPHRRAFIGIKDDQDRDIAATELVGFPLARLYSNRLISRDQFEAGEHYARLVHSYASIMGIPVGSPRSGALLSMQGGGFYRWEGEDGAGDNEEAQKRVQRIRSDYNDCHDTLYTLGVEHKSGRKILIVMREICVAELDEREMWGKSGEAKLGDLRLGLNAVHKILVGHKK